MNDLEKMQEAWRLYRALKDKAKFDKLTTKEKLEALRIAAIQGKDTA